MAYSLKLKFSEVVQRSDYTNLPSLPSRLIIPYYLPSSLIPWRCLLRFIQHFQLFSVGEAVCTHSPPHYQKSYHMFLHACSEAAKLLGRNREIELIGWLHNKFMISSLSWAFSLLYLQLFYSSLFSSISHFPQQLFQPMTTLLKSSHPIPFLLCSFSKVSLAPSLQKKKNDLQVGIPSTRLHSTPKCSC